MAMYALFYKRPSDESWRYVGTTPSEESVGEWRASISVVLRIQLREAGKSSEDIESRIKVVDLE